MTDSNDELNTLLIDSSDSLEGSPIVNMRQESDTMADEVSKRRKTSEYKQWTVEPNDCFRPAGSTQNILDSGVYTVDRDEYGIFFHRVNVITDNLINLPDTANDHVLQGMRKFWKRKERYTENGFLYKRGFFLWGPPGGGKTATVTMLSRDLIAEGGLVIMCESPSITSKGLSALRRIEPNRPIVCIEEDIDEMISINGEHQLLALLDGENQVENIVHVATTNYPEKLGARIINRPSRFDERIKIGMPSAEARKIYLRHTAKNLDETKLEQWVADSEGFSVAHLRELTAAVLCLDQPYDEVISRLKSMKYHIKGEDGFGGKLGFLDNPSTTQQCGSRSY
jgi:hypothetical protein